MTRLRIYVKIIIQIIIKEQVYEVLKKFESRRGGGSELVFSLLPELRASLYGCRQAFTLAETLVTIAIVGVVAAISLPPLVSKHKDKVYEAQYKKSQSVLAQGFNLMMAKNEVTSVSDIPLISCLSGNLASCGGSVSSEADLVNFVSSEFKKYFSIVDDAFLGDNNYNDMLSRLPQEYNAPSKTQYVSFSWDQIPYIFTTADGMTYGWNMTSDMQNGALSIVVDTNTAKTPNAPKQDLYKYMFANGILVDISDELINEIKDCSTKESGCTLNDFVAYMDSIGKSPYKANGDPCYGADGYYNLYCR